MVMNAAKTALTFKQIKDDPFGYLSDKIIAVLVNSLIPIPLSGDVIVQFKRPVMAILITFVVFMLFMVTVVGTLIMSPLLLGSSVFDNVAAIFQNPTNIALDSSFGDTSVPKKSPFSGNGMEYVSITSYFLEPSYYMQFGRTHSGLDMVPSQSYYSNSQTYKDTHQVVVFSTISGTVREFVDEYGGETVEITNADNTFKVLFIHFSSKLVKTGDIIKSGTPVGIMGGTGFATGDHVHYEVKIKDGETWRAVNPLSYIQ